MATQEPNKMTPADAVTPVSPEATTIPTMTGITAEELTKPAPSVTVPQPTVAEDTFKPSLIKGVVDSGNQIIAAQTEEAKQLAELRAQQAALSGESSLSDLFAAGQKQYQIPENLKKLQDVQMQIADITGESLGVQSAIARAAGQTSGQGSREISAERARSNARSYGLAAQAAILQGNIQTATNLVNQAVQTAYQDRTLRNTNLINQINSLQSVVDGQTAQLLEKDRRKYEEDQRQIVRAETAVDAAVASGYASDADIQEIMKLSGDPQMQADYARSIIAKGAIEQRILDTRAKNTSITASGLAARKSLVELAMAGDPNAVAQLGFDPAAEIRAAAEAEDATTRAQEEMAAEKEIQRLDDVMTDITDLLGNNTGLKSSTGQFRNATIAGLTPFVGESLSELSGGIPGAISARQEKDDWLAKAGTVLTQEGFESLININERVRLTPITNAEISLAFKAASDLNYAAIKKGDPEKGTQRIVGFRMSEEEVRNTLADMYLTAQKVQEEVKGIQQYGYEGYVRLMELEQQVQQ